MVCGTYDPLISRLNTALRNYNSIIKVLTKNDRDQYYCRCLFCGCIHWKRVVNPCCKCTYVNCNIFFFQNKSLGKSLTLKSGPLPGSFLFGTPSYPSPLDRIRPTKKDRAIELGLSSALQDSLDLNATFPKVYKAKSKQEEHQMDLFKPKRNLDQISSKIWCT